MPQWVTPHEAKQSHTIIIGQRRNKGPLYILGDWNARLAYPMPEIEQEIIGKHTLHQDSEIVMNFTESMKESRDQW